MSPLPFLHVLPEVPEMTQSAHFNLHLLHKLLIQNLLHGEKLNDPPRPLVERVAFLHRIG